MTVQEMIFNYDMQKILDACCDILPEHIDAEKYRPDLEKYLYSLKDISAEESSRIIISRLAHDFDNEASYDACAIHEYDVERLTRSYHAVQEYRKNMDKAYQLFNGYYENWNAIFYIPEQYAFEFTATSEILGYQVLLPNVSEEDTYKAIAAIIDEMTFFGFDEIEKEKTWGEVQQNAEELDRILELPEEEQAQYFYTAEEMFPDFESLRPTEEEKEEMRRSLVRECFDNIEYLYKLLCVNESQ